MLRRRSAANTKPDADVAPVACPGIPRTPEAQPAFWKPLLVSIPVSEQRVCDPETGLDESLFVPVLHRVLAAGINPPGGSMRDVRAIRCHLVRDWLGCRDASGKSRPPAWRNEGMREWDRARSVHGRNRVGDQSLRCGCLHSGNCLVGLGWCCAGVGGPFQQASSSSRDLQCLTRPGSSLAGPLWGERGARDGAGLHRNAGKRWILMSLRP